MNALRTGMIIDTAYQGTDVQFWRMSAMDVLMSYGYSWPSLLDDEYPSSNDAEEGVKYVDVVIE